MLSRTLISNHINGTIAVTDTTLCCDNVQYEILRLAYFIMVMHAVLSQLSITEAARGQINSAVFLMI